MNRAILLPIGMLAVAVAACQEGERRRDIADGDRGALDRDQVSAAPPADVRQPVGEKGVRPEPREQTPTARTETGEAPEASKDNRELVAKASAVLDRMKSDPELARLLDQARGVFIVPDYARAAMGVGASGGAGLLLARNDGGWTGPAFYDIGAVSAGPQAGASGGSVAMLLVSQRALERFQARDKFSLGAEAGVTLLDYSAVRGRADFGQGTDVILWSDAQGVFAGASLAITDIAFDEEANRSYYDEPATPEAILKGEVQNAEAEMLRKKLAG